MRNEWLTSLNTQISSQRGLTCCVGRTSSESLKIDKNKDAQMEPLEPYLPCAPKGELTEMKPGEEHGEGCLLARGARPVGKTNSLSGNLLMLRIFLKTSLSTKANNSSQTKLGK